MFWLALLCCLLTNAVSQPLSGGGSEEEAWIWLSEYSKEAIDQQYLYSAAEFGYETNITEANEAKLLEVSTAFSTFKNEKTKEAQIFEYESYKNESLKRILKKVSFLGVSILEGSDLEQYNKVVNDMSNIYNTLKICPPCKRDCDLETEGWPLSPDISDFMASSRNYGDLSYVWEALRDATGRKIHDMYFDYRELGNKAANMNGFEDLGKMWVYDYEMDMDKDFREEAARLWEEVYPLYQQMHAYVRHRLMKYYEEEYKAGARDPIPEHILGSTVGSGWEHIYDIVKPFEGTSEVDITDALVEQGYDALKVFQTSDSFFTSLGLLPMSAPFWDYSLMEKPDDRPVSCHAEAYGFAKNDDVRIKMCTTMTHGDFMTVHHEMGHCEYFLLYMDLPFTFQDGGNGGFHEAIGDTIALSVQTPQHLHTIGLLDKPDDTDEFNINFLMKMALNKVGQVAFNYNLDLWRWHVFAKAIPDEEVNEHYWELRKTYFGINAPVERKSGDLDPGAVFHVCTDWDVIRYYISHILQFSFYKAACEAAGEYPAQELHKCDYYNSKAAGDMLRNGMQVGCSQPWPQTLEEMTGDQDISVSAILEYFQPLKDFLEKYNKENNVEVGWQ